MQARFLYSQAVYRRGGEMDTRHQKDAMSTDHKTRTDDEHIHELDKRHLKQSEKDEKDADLIPKPGGKATAETKE